MDASSLWSLFNLPKIRYFFLDGEIHLSYFGIHIYDRYGRKGLVLFLKSLIWSWWTVPDATWQRMWKRHSEELEHPRWHDTNLAAFKCVQEQANQRLSQGRVAEMAALWWSGEFYGMVAIISFEISFEKSFETNKTNGKSWLIYLQEFTKSGKRKFANHVEVCNWISKAIWLS